MQTHHIAEADLYQPQSLAAFRNVKLLVRGYLGISVLTLAAIVVLRDNVSITPIAVWVREVIVVAHALLMNLFAALAARGSRRGYLLLWLASSIMFVAIVVIIAIPGDFPLWFKIDQGVCGLLLLGVVAVINGKHVRAVFAKTQK